MDNWLAKFQALRVFTPSEAFRLFILAALAEAIGWAMLLVGMVIHYYGLPGQAISIPIAGQIHGTFFIAYFIVLIAIYPSIQWKRISFLSAIMAGILPFGTLFFELWASRNQKKVIAQDCIHFLIWDGHKLLAAQPSKGIEWELPSEFIPSGEDHQAAAAKSLKDIFGISIVPRLIYSKSNNQISDYYYTVSRPSLFFKADLIRAEEKASLIDEFAVIESRMLPKQLRLLFPTLVSQTKN